MIRIDDASVYWVRNQNSTEFKCRVKLSMFGFYEPTKEEMKMSAFDPDYHGPFAEGYGKTKEEAIENLNQDLEEQSNAFWEV